MLKHIWIPVIVIAAGSTAWLTRVMRANLLDVLNSQYIQTARAKGVSERRVIWKHAVRNAINPLIMALGTTLPVMISGEAIVGDRAGPAHDRAAVPPGAAEPGHVPGGQLLMLLLLLIVGNLLADLVLAWVDPRARLRLEEGCDMSMLQEPTSGRHSDGRGSRDPATVGEISQFRLMARRFKKSKLSVFG